MATGGDETGFAYQRTRLFDASAISTSPEPSTATPSGWQSTAPLGAIPPPTPPHADMVKLPFWPKTTSAVTSPELPGVPGDPPPAATGFRYSSTRLLLMSLTNKSPALSSAKPLKLQMPSALGAGSPELPS